MKQKITSISLLFIFCLIVTQTLLHPVLAIGPGTGGSKIRVNEERIGPYILLVATSPLPVTLDQQMSVWVRVIDPTTNELRPDAAVTVVATHRETGQTLTAPATHRNAGNDHDYVAHFDIENAGPWEITVNISDEPGEAEVSFVERVSAGLSLALVAVLGIPFAVLVMIIGVYLWRRSESVPDTTAGGRPSF